jgi:hypothetical protein
MPRIESACQCGHAVTTSNEQYLDVVYGYGRKPHTQRLVPNELPNNLWPVAAHAQTTHCYDLIAGGVEQVGIDAAKEIQPQMADAVDRQLTRESFG